MSRMRGLERPRGRLLRQLRHVFGLVGLVGEHRYADLHGHVGEHAGAREPAHGRLGGDGIHGGSELSGCPGTAAERGPCGGPDALGSSDGVPGRHSAEGFRGAVRDACGSRLGGGGRVGCTRPRVVVAVPADGSWAW
ncbi:hypothetical protein [Streptomyces sp. NPDC002671]